MRPKSPMHDGKKSDSPIVATKPTNKAAPAVAEPAEPRGETKGNADQQSTPRTQSRTSVSPALDRVRQAARERPKERLTALSHHVTVDLLQAAFAALRREAAPGADGVTWSTYGENLEANIQNLHQLQKCCCHRGVAQNPTSHRQVVFRQRRKRNDHPPTFIERRRWIANVEMPDMEIGVSFELLAIWFHYAHLMSAILPARLGDREVRYYCQTEALKLKHLFDSQEFSLRHAVRLPLRSMSATGPARTRLGSAVQLSEPQSPQQTSCRSALDYIAETLPMSAAPPQQPPLEESNDGHG
jgi:hypothetical protein